MSVYNKEDLDYAKEAVQSDASKEIEELRSLISDEVIMWTRQYSVNVMLTTAEMDIEPLSLISNTMLIGIRLGIEMAQRKSQNQMTINLGIVQ